MEYLEAVLLGLLQGLTEFLPVSSSGHLLLFESWGVGEPSLAVNIFLHIGTLLSVLVIYRKQVWKIIKKPFTKEVGFYALACIPTGIIALIFLKWFKGALGGSFLPLNFLITAFLLVMADNARTDQLKPLNAKNTLLTGIFQGLAVLPGISRSGATIAAMTMCRVPKENAADFSFMLSIPVIIIAGITEAIGGKFSTDIQLLPLLAGMAAAFLSGIFAIKFILKIIKTKRFYPFAIYLVAVAIVSFITLY